MNDNATEALDQLTAAARAELDDIQRRIKATWDVEAGLREILLDEHYHRFTEQPVSGFDVETGLAAVLAGDAHHDTPDNVDSTPFVRHDALINQLFAHAHADVLRPPQETTFDRVRRIGHEVKQTAAILVLQAIEGLLPDDDGLKGQLAQAMIHGNLLTALADDLADGLVGLKDALQVVTEAADVLMATYETLIDLRTTRRTKGGGAVQPPATRAKVLDLAIAVSRLQQPIRRLFDPSEETVGSLL
ncbi:hypothetical protein [Micromonospora aurantiaca (nom. illeg.)]|uniref:hypothetical protein n=1 Tax=Micromonospora aurantiaca (nom. illeg.) TaxID=47850 RepID=UPI0001DF6F0C|nr:hypothetical protein [Micromonospora aurantiaca]ADL47660.1 hypothetical protein Micau_4146 [Micromonospora aurantiaca ATCC 27029]